MLPKLVISLSLLVIGLFIVPFSVSAQTLPPSPLPLPAIVSPTSPLYTDLLINNLFHSFSCLAIGQSVLGQPCLTYQMTKNAQGVLQGVPVLSQINASGGTLGATGSLISALYMNPPIRTADYLASIGKGMGIVKEAHAAVTGSGAEVLKPVLALWQVSRNISYVILIVIFVIIGLMIMFRNKLNPQTVITAQAALPGLVIGLILITFSYFLAGLVSDMAFIGTNLVGYYFVSAQNLRPEVISNCQKNLVDCTRSENVLSIFSKFVGMVDSGKTTDAVKAIWNNLDGAAQGWLRLISAALIFQQTFQTTSLFQVLPKIGMGIQAILSIGAAGIAAADPAPLVGLMLSFIALLILMYAMLKLLFRLINNFLNIIFLTISAPFQFLAASLPGRQGIATGWILSMLCNVLAFPAVMGVLYFVAFLMKDVDPTKSYAPFNISNSLSLAGSSSFPLFGGMDLKLVNLLLAFGALVALPAIPDIICRAIGRASQAGQLLGQEISGGMKSGQGYVGQFQQGITQAGERGGGLWNKRATQMQWDNEAKKWKLIEGYNAGGITHAREAGEQFLSKVGTWLKMREAKREKT